MCGSIAKLAAASCVRLGTQLALPCLTRFLLANLRSKRHPSDLQGADGRLCIERHPSHRRAVNPAESAPVPHSSMSSVVVTAAPRPRHSSAFPPHHASGNRRKPRARYVPRPTTPPCVTSHFAPPPCPASAAREASKAAAAALQAEALCGAETSRPAPRPRSVWCGWGAVWWGSSSAAVSSSAHQQQRSSGSVLALSPTLTAHTRSMRFDSEVLWRRTAALPAVS